LESLLRGRCRIITLELAKVWMFSKKPVQAMTAQEQWACFFRYLTNRRRRGMINELLKQEEGIAMAGEVLINISRSEIEQARRASRLKYVLDTQSALVHAKRTGEKQAEKRLNKVIEEQAQAIEALRQKLREVGIEEN
jgi:hypothetical protein